MFDIFLSQSKILEQLGGTWVIALLVFTRCIAFASTAPMIGHKSIPSLVRVSFSIILTLILFPLLDVPDKYPKSFEFVYLIIINVFIGMMIGWVTNLVIEIGKAAGEMMDMQLGLQSATLFDPGSQTQTTILGKFFDMVTLTLFISIGGFERLIEGFFKSYDVFPVIIYSFDFGFFKLVKAAGDVLALGFLIVSPIVIIILTIDLILGLMSRAAPQINAFQISFSIKPTVGMVLLLILLPALFQVISSLISSPFRFF